MPHLAIQGGEPVRHQPNRGGQSVFSVVYFYRFTHAIRPL